MIGLKFLELENKRSLRKCIAILILAILTSLVSCNTIDDDRIPSMPVNINLSSQAYWSTYGVAGYGMYRYFIAQLREPRNFPYTQGTATGYGGVLLVSGFNPFTQLADEPMAYDLACPVECRPDVRVSMQPGEVNYDAVCPECGSHYDVIELGGSPTAGPAKSRHLGLRRYECRRSAYGGYVILNY